MKTNCSIARYLTREEQDILRGAMRDSVRIISSEGDMQDGMLAYYLEQVKASDVNVEKRIDREPFDYREHLNCRKNGKSEV